MSDNWSAEQNIIIRAIRDGKDSLLINSVAGSGKTSVIVAGAEFVPANSIFLAFNKKIVLELTERLPSHVQAQTFHALCYKFLRDRLPRGLKVDKYKNLNLVQKIDKTMEESKWEVNRLVGLMKNLGVGIILPCNSDVVEEIRENYDVTSEDCPNEHLVEVAIKVLKRGAKDLTVIDMDDMIYMCLKLVVEKGWAMDKYNTVFIDEAQDTNEVQLHLLGEMAERVIGVGDEFQAIYGFRGAGSNSMALIQEKFDCEVLPMTTSWRCPVSVGEVARRIVPEFQVSPNAIQGEVLFIGKEEMHLGYHAGNLYLCRMNYPLFEVAIDLLKKRIPFNMTGNFPQRLIGFVVGFKAKSLPDLRKKLEAWWVEKEKDLTQRSKFGLLERERDKYGCLLSLIKECSSPKDLVYNLECMTTAKGGVKLSTVHGAKGLEAKTVVIVAPELMPSKYAKTDEQLQQETNLKYVAETRALERLVYCDFGGE